MLRFSVNKRIFILTNNTYCMCHEMSMCIVSINLFVLFLSSIFGEKLAYFNKNKQIKHYVEIKIILFNICVFVMLNRLL